MQYVDYVKSTYGNPVIVFDGYSLPSVKDMLHRVRNKGRLGVEITFTRDMVLNVSKDVFSSEQSQQTAIHQHAVQRASQESLPSPSLPDRC